MKNFNVLINTCDRFEDCWDPFFKLFTIYWPDFKGRIYLNTEYKDYSYPGLNITAVKGCAVNNIPKTKRATWSECLQWALQSMDDEIVLYMQEDYFLTSSVDTEWCNHFFNLMNQDSSIPCIQLTGESIPAVSPANYDKLFASDPGHFSYVCCQASFWRKDILLALLRKHETAWNFEWWGSKRAKYSGLRFLVVDPRWVSTNTFQIIPYLFTGVIGGKWYRPVVGLFEKHGITMDFSKRGFYEKNEFPTLKKRIKTKLSIWNIRSVMEVLKLKIKSYVKWK